AVYLVRRRRPRHAGALRAAPGPVHLDEEDVMNSSRFIPGLAVVATALFFISRMITPASPEEDFNFERFARVPIVERGRVKPIDTLARIDLMLVSDKSDYQEFKSWEEYEQV